MLVVIVVKFQFSGNICTEAVLLLLSILNPRRTYPSLQGLGTYARRSG